MEFDFNYINDERSIEGIAKVSAQTIQHIWNVEPLDPAVTLLPFDIYVIANRETDKPLCVYIPEDYKDPKFYYAVTVSGSPDFLYENWLVDIKLSESDIMNVIRFIAAYKNMLTNIANNKISCGSLNRDAITFAHTPVNESYLVGKRPVNEMANLYRGETKLPVDVWVDLNGSWREQTAHGYRFKFKDKNSHELLPMTLPDLDTPLGTGKLKYSDIMALQTWAAWNMPVFEHAKFTPNLGRNFEDKFLRYTKSGCPCMLNGEQAIEEVMPIDVPKGIIIRNNEFDCYNVMIDDRLITSQWFKRISRELFYDYRTPYLKAVYITSHGKSGPEYKRHECKLYLDGTIEDISLEPFENTSQTAVWNRSNANKELSSKTNRKR